VEGFAKKPKNKKKKKRSALWLKLFWTFCPKKKEEKKTPFH